MPASYKNPRFLQLLSASAATTNPNSLVLETGGNITVDAANNLASVSNKGRDLVEGERLYVATTGGGMTAGTTYFVRKTGLTLTTDQVGFSTTLGGSLVDLTGSIGNLLFRNPGVTNNNPVPGAVWKTLNGTPKFLLPLLPIDGVGYNSPAANYDRPIALAVDGTFTSATLDLYLYCDLMDDWLQPTQNTPRVVVTSPGMIYISNTQGLPAFIHLSAFTGTNVVIAVDTLSATVG